MAILRQWQGVLIAFLLTTLLIGRLAPVEVIALREWGFWLIWLASVLLLSAPLLLLESALAKRSQALPLIALPALTRDADASTRWRIVGWLGLLGALLLAGKLSAHVDMLGNMLLHAVNPTVTNQAPSPLMLWGTLLASIVAVFALSFIALQRLALAGVVLMLGVVVLEALNVPFDFLQTTTLSLRLWPYAVALALVSTGLGLGVYWAGLNDPTVAAKVGQSKGYGSSKAETPRRSILAILIAQIVAGVLVVLGYCAEFPNYLASVGLQQTAVAQHLPVLYNYTWALNAAALACAAALLLGFVRLQLRARGMAPIIVALISLAALLLWFVLPGSILTPLTAVVVLLAVAIYAIFSGWKMKTSHLRKALNFNNEALYNIWRVQIRILIPLAVLAALIGIIQHVLQQGLAG